jgi:4-amino-4-deoxy-L-arabinose transferase-like glycosyltransferase
MRISLQVDVDTFRGARLGVSNICRLMEKCCINASILTFLVLLVFASLLFLVGLEKRHLWDADEPRVAGISAEMARTKDLVVPRLNGRPFIEKPPLYFWTASTAFRLFGENTYVARLIPALSAIFCVVIVFLLALSMNFSIRGAFMSGFVLATSAGYWSIGRTCLIDMTLCLFITTAMASFYQVVRSAQGGAFWYIIFIFSMGCALLTKGLVGLAIPVSAIVIWLILEKDFSWRRWFALLTCIILCSIPYLVWLWHLYIDMGKDAVYETFWINNFGRFTGTYPQHFAPFYYYLTKFPATFMPWTFFLPLAGFLVIRQAHKRDKTNPSIFILTWFVVPFILLSVAATKRSLYLLPIYPVAALTVGYTVDIVLSNKEKLTAWFDIPSSILAGIAVITPLVFLGICFYFHQPFVILAFVSIPGTILGLWAYRLLTKKDMNRFFQMLVPAFLLIFLSFDTAIQPNFNPKESFEPLFKYADELRSKGAQIGILLPAERLDGAAVFYLGECIPRFNSLEAAREFLNSGENKMVMTREENIEKNHGICIINSFNIGNKNVVFFNAKTFTKGQ